MLIDVLYLKGKVDPKGNPARYKGITVDQRGHFPIHVSDMEILEFHPVQIRQRPVLVMSWWGAQRPGFLENPTSLYANSFVPSFSERKLWLRVCCCGNRLCETTAAFVQQTLRFSLSPVWNAYAPPNNHILSALLLSVALCRKKIKAGWTVVDMPCPFLEVPAEWKPQGLMRPRNSLHQKK